MNPIYCKVDRYGVLQLVRGDLGTMTSRDGASVLIQFAVLVFKPQILPPYDSYVTAGKHQASSVALTLR